MQCRAIPPPHIKSVKISLIMLLRFFFIPHDCFYYCHKYHHHPSILQHTLCYWPTSRSITQCMHQEVPHKVPVLVPIPRTVIPVCESGTRSFGKKSLQYGLRWLKSISQRWGPGSRWNHLLAFYVTPTSRSNAFWNVKKTPNIKQIVISHFWKRLFPVISKLGVFKLI